MIYLAGIRTSLARWFGLTERCSRFLSSDMATQIYDEGMRFLHTHLELSRLSVRPSSGKLRLKAAVSLKDDFTRWVESPGR